MAEQNEALIDAATKAHEAFDKNPTQANRDKLRKAQVALGTDELLSYASNYNNRLARRKAEEAQAQTSKRVTGDV